MDERKELAYWKNAAQVMAEEADVLAKERNQALKAYADVLVLVKAKDAEIDSLVAERKEADHWFWAALEAQAGEAAKRVRYWRRRAAHERAAFWRAERRQGPGWKAADSWMKGHDEAISERDEAKAEQMRLRVVAKGRVLQHERLRELYDEVLKERDEARVERDEVIRDQVSERTRLVLERDEALERIATLQEEIKATEMWPALREWYGYAQRLEKERDETRAALFDAQVIGSPELQAVNVTSNIGRAVTQLVKDRQEARRVAARLWQQCKAADALLDMARYGVDFTDAYDAARFEKKLAQYDAVCMKTREEAGT